MSGKEHHTIEVWNENASLTKYDVLLAAGKYNYQWCASADQHFTFPRASCVYHVIVFGHKIDRTQAETYMLAAENGQVEIIKLVND